MSEFNIGDLVNIVGCSSCEGRLTVNRIGKTGSVKDRSKDNDHKVYIAVHFDEENDWWWFNEKDLELVATAKEQQSGGLNNYWLVDVKNPQRGGEPYQAEADDIIFALNMTFDEGEAFKAIWRTCTARLGYGKKDNTALYNAQKLVHRSNRILQRAELEEGTK